VKVNYEAKRNPPKISAQPLQQSANTGNSVTFTVAASGTGPLSYQWRRNGSNLPGQKNATLTLSGVTVADAGSYDVVISNSVGTVTSETVTLTVQPPPTVPPTLGAPSLDANGRLRFLVQGTVGALVSIEMATDLKTFNPVLTTNLPPGGFLFTDTSPPTVSRVFRLAYP
jgi:hypothetical protein